MSFRGPLAGSYASAVALVLLALCPYLVLTTAAHPLDALVGPDLGLSAKGLALTGGFANAAYSFGCVLAAQFAQKGRGRRLLLGYAVAFVLASLLAASAPTVGLYVAGRIVQGLTTGMMLIAAAPTLVLGWGPEKLPRTAVVMNLGIFGAVALGPVIGGAAGGLEEWRGLMWAVAGLGLGTVSLILLTFTDQEPMDPTAPWDPLGIGLAGAATGSLFFGVSYLSSSSLTSPVVLVPIVVGVLTLLATIVWEYRSERALMPLRGLAHTFPVVGIITAMIAGASSVSLVELAQEALDHKGASALHAGMLFWPELGGALIAAISFGALFRTRYPPVLAFSGLLLMGAGGALLVGAATGPDALVAVGSGLVGAGTGLSVAPALFVVGFSLPSRNLPRIFALIELLRGVAAFLAGPLLLHLAQTVGGSEVEGLRTAGWIAFAMPLVGAAVVLAIFLLGHGRLRRPHVERWVDGEEPAIESGPVLAAVRARRVPAA